MDYKQVLTQSEKRAMRTFVAGVFVGAFSVGLVLACGVPDHFHNTNDIKTIGTDGGSAGVCKCKEPTNTLKLKDVELDCNMAPLPGNTAGVELAGFRFNEIVSMQISREGADVRIAQPISYKMIGGKIYVGGCERGKRFKLSILVR